MPVSMKAYKGCQSSGQGRRRRRQEVRGPADEVPGQLHGSITPSATPGDSTLSFACTQNVRAFALYSNKSIDLPGDEPVVTGDAGGKTNEGALHQCEGAFPGPGYGCGIVNRQEQTAPGTPGLPNGDTISAGNTATQTMGFDSDPASARVSRSRRPGWS